MKNYGGLLRLVVLVWAILIVYCLCRAEQEEVYEPVEEPVEVMTVEYVEQEEDLEIYHLEAITYYPVPLDHDLQAHIIRTCDEYGVDSAVVVAMIERESGFDANAIGDNGDSIGLMQIQPKWHQDRMDKHGVTDLLNPYQNVSVGIDYMAELLDRYPLESALTAYNSGSPGESEYAKGIVAYMEELKR